MSEAQLFVATAFTEIYERVLVGPLFRPFAEQLVARVAPQPGQCQPVARCSGHLGSQAVSVGSTTYRTAPAAIAMPAGTSARSMAATFRAGAAGALISNVPVDRALRPVRPR